MLTVKQKTAIFRRLPPNSIVLPRPSLGKGDWAGEDKRTFLCSIKPVRAYSPRTKHPILSLGNVVIK